MSHTVTSGPSTAPSGSAARQPRLSGWALALGACAALAGHPVSAQTGLDGIKQRGQIVIGYRTDASPFSLQDASGQPVGYAVEVCQWMSQRLAQAAGIPPTAVKYLNVPVDQIERYVRGNTVDLLCSATSDTAARRQSMAFSAPIYVAQLKVAVRRKDNIQALAQLSGKPVVVIGRTTAETTLPRVASERGLGFTLAKAVGADAALGQLKLGWVSGYARDDVLLASQIAASPDRADYTILPDALAEEPIAIAFSRGDDRLVQTLNAALAEAVRNGTWQAAYDKWFTRPIAPHGQSLGIPASEALKAALAKVK